MILVDKIRQYRETRNYERFLTANTWEGYVPGDVVEIRKEVVQFGGNSIRYRGIDRCSFPPRPSFGSANPRDPILYYLRQEGDPQNPTKEEAARTHLVYLSLSRDDLKKVGHIAAKDWNRMVAEVRAELFGKAVLKFDASDM